MARVSNLLDEEFVNERLSPSNAEFWRILTQTPVPVDRFLLGRVQVLDKKARFLYLLEFLITDTLATLDEKSKWYVSGVGPDGGIDFEGHSPLVKVSLFSLDISTAVIGQIKRMKNHDDDIIRSALSKMNDVRRRRNVSAVLFVVSTEKKNVQSIKNKIEDKTYCVDLDVERHFLDIESFMGLWAHHRQYLRKTLDMALPAAQASFIYEEILGRGIQPGLDRKPCALVIQAEFATRTVDQGVPFRVSVSVGFPHFLSLQTIRLKHEPPATSAGVVTAVRPSLLRHPQGGRFQFREAMTVIVDIWLRAETAGLIELGQLLAWDAGEFGDPVSIDLGAVNASARFVPAYFPDPNLAAKERLDGLLRCAIAGQTTSAFIVGAGGAGKTNLCNATIDDAVDRGFRTIRLLVSDVTDPHVDLAELIRQVHGAHGSLGVPQTEEILGTISAMIGAKGDVLAEMRGCLDPLDQPLRPRDLSIGLCALFVRSLQGGPLIVHIQNMHWSSKQLLDTLGLVILGLQDAETAIGTEFGKRLPNGVFFLLEGRIGEARRLSGVRLNVQPWLDFQETSKFLEIRLPRWTRHQSRQFIERLIPERTPIGGAGFELRDAVVAYVEQRSSGSPMHIVEQVRLLFDEGTLCHAPDGRLEVRRDLKTFRPVPGNVGDAIMDRWRFLYSKSPGLAEILILLAKTGHANDRAYVEQLLSSCSPPLSSSDLDQTECIHPPRHGDTNYEFVHENFVETFQDLPIDGRSPLLARAVAWHMANASLSTRWTLNLVKLLLLRWRPPYSRIIKLATLTLARARKARSPGDIEISLRSLLRVPHDRLRKAGMSPEKLHYDLAVFLEGASSWEAALAEFDHLYAKCERLPHDPDTRIVMAEVAAEKANVLVDLQRTCEALDAVEQGMRIASELRERSLNADQALRIERLEDKLLHRKAVGLWFDGQQAAAAIAQRSAWSRARGRCDRPSLAVILRESGTLLLHTHTRRGLELLRIADKMDAQEKAEIAPVDCMVTKIQYLLAQLVVASERGDASEGFRRIATELMGLHESGVREGLAYEPALAALLAGGAVAMMGDYRRAHRLFRLAMIQASQNRLHNIMWQSRINLAQTALRMGDPTEARHHADETVAIIQSGLENASSPTDRLQLMVLPLRQALKCGAEDNKAWIESQLLKSTGHSTPTTPLHCRVGQDCYFLMN